MKWTRMAALMGIALLAVACSDDDPVDLPTPPEAPTGVTAATSGSGFDITVSWTAAANADDYRVTLSSGGALVEETTTGGNAATFSQLSGGTTYTVSVFARNADGQSTAVEQTVTTGSLNKIFYETAGFNNTMADPGFDPSVFEFGTQAAPPDFTLAAMPAGYQAATIPTGFDANLIVPTDGRTLVNTNYAGAIAPGTPLGGAWYNGWTVWAENGEDGRPINLPIVQVTNDILVNTTWTSNNIYRLNQPTFVGVDCGTDGTLEGCTPVTLTIQPGTTIIGNSATPQGVRGAYLVVSRGSMIMADATSGVNRPPTAAEAIVFTSELPPGQRAVEDWGGLIINGQAPTNAGEEATGEGDSRLYGGPDVNDNSGILRGVRIEYAGDDVTPSDQLNGLALQGVGAGTTISYVQIHYNKDDGIEPFGGAVSVDHLVLTGIGDDSVDGTDGYRGFMQFIIGQQNGRDADQGFEISNNGDDGAASPKSSSIIANATMIGAGQNVVAGGIAGAESDNGIQFREGSHYRVFNSIFTGFGEAGFCIRDGQTIVNALNRLDGSSNPTSTLRAEGLLMWSNQSAGASDDNFAPCGGGSS